MFGDKGFHFVTSGTHNPDQFTGMPDPLATNVRRLAYPPEATESAQRDGRRRYSTSKLANLQTTYELARQFGPRGITVNAFDPGLMPGTGLARDAGAAAKLLWRTVPLLLRLAARGLGIAIVPALTTEEADAFGVRVLPLIEPELRRQLALAWRRERLGSPAAKVLLGQLRIGLGAR